MTQPLHIVVCASVVPDPLQTLEPITSPAGPALKNEMMLPAILDPWAAHALYEGSNLVKRVPGSTVVAGQHGAEGQAAAGDDDHRAESPSATGGRRRPLRRLRRRTSDRNHLGESHPCDTRPRSFAAAALRRMGVGQPQRRRDAATRRRRAWHRRPVSGSRRHHAQRRWLLRSAGTRRRRAPPDFDLCRCSRGPRMGDGQSAASRATIRKLA